MTAVGKIIWTTADNKEEITTKVDVVSQCVRIGRDRRIEEREKMNTVFKKVKEDKGTEIEDLQRKLAALKSSVGLRGIQNWMPP